MQSRAADGAGDAVQGLVTGAYRVSKECCRNVSPASRKGAARPM